MAIFGLAMSLGALAGTPRPKASAKRSTIGTLIVYRPGSFAGIGRTYSFSIDNGPRHKLKNGRYMQFELAPGDHILRTARQSRRAVWLFLNRLEHHS